MTTMTTRIHQVRATGRKVAHEHDRDDAAPEYEVTSPESHYAYGPGEVHQLPDGTFAYAYDVAGLTGLFREAVALDDGENELRRRTAPADLAGLTAPERRGPALTAVGSGLVGWLA